MRSKSNSFVCSYCLLRRMVSAKFNLLPRNCKVIAKRPLERDSKLDQFREEKGIFILCKICNPTWSNYQLLRYFNILFHHLTLRPCPMSWYSLQSQSWRELIFKTHTRARVQIHPFKVRNETNTNRDTELLFEEEIVSRFPSFHVNTIPNEGEGLHRQETRTKGKTRKGRIAVGGR